MHLARPQSYATLAGVAEESCDRERGRENDAAGAAHAVIYLSRAAWTRRGAPAPAQRELLFYVLNCVHILLL